MHTKAAYDAVQHALEANPDRRIVRSAYDDEMFGNFVVAFTDGGQPASIVNDRGQLLLYDGLDANQFRRTLLNDLYSADEATVISAANLRLPV